MGDLTFFVSPATATTLSAAAAAPEPEPGPAAATTGRAPRCRRVRFRDVAAATLWLPPSPPPNVDATAEAEPAPGRGPEDEEEAKPAASELAEEEEDRMDLLWEDFNEELLAMRRAAGSCSRAGGLPELTSESTSDGEYEPAAERGVHGCFPVLRPAARAGGAGQYYRRRAGSWVLLMRIFRRLFVIDKTITAR